MLNLEVIDIDKDIAIDKEPQKWDNGVNDSNMNIKELKDVINGYSLEEKQIVTGKFVVDILWDALRKKKTILSYYVN